MSQLWWTHSALGGLKPGEFERQSPFNDVVHLDLFPVSAVYEVDDYPTPRLDIRQQRLNR
uniref:Uncharacterized protein n=1 Tax=candidate division WOR-3 bacterium TaxID=2052148 RepID=A0A7C6EB98_UNCW3